MSLDVGGIAELVGDKGVGVLFMKLLCLGDCAVHALPGRGQDDLRPQSGKETPALLAHVFGHGQHQLQAAGGADIGKANAGIAGGRLNDHGSGLDFPGFLGFIDHIKGGTVLDGAKGVKVFQLGIDGCGCTPNPSGALQL